MRKLAPTLIIILALLFTPLNPSQAAVSSRQDDPQEQAQKMLDTLTPEERVGQLFLVTFYGTSADRQSQIYDLVTLHHIGGVILLATNNNFTEDDQTPEQTTSLTSQLQRARWAASQQLQQNPVSGERFAPAFIPLFIGISQEGDGYPYDQILHGLTPLPNQMALGATWNPEQAAQVGQVLGQELSSLGINLLLGPSLDVLETPHLEGSYDLGTRSFGGDPFWVGEMGRAYIKGVHQGSFGKIAVVAKHFPGHGGSDRLPEQEVATVRKSLEQLKNFELTPFFAVTGNAPDAGSTTDALLASHIRYQGFQGNIRATTRPVSYDPQAFSLLMGLPNLDSWRKNGGLMISDDLGSRAIRRFYDLTSQAFDARRVALNAFLAGNDLLYVGDFSSANDPDSYPATIRTLDFFSQKYRDDAAFAQRVNESVLRILTLKYRLFQQFSLSQVLPSTQQLANVGKSEQITFDVARQAATLISPTQAELDDTIPDPPNLNDRLVFITDSRQVQPCDQCKPETLVSLRAMEQVVLRRYGPQTGNQVSPNNLSSYTMNELKLMLDSGRGQSQLESDLNRANWIVFLMQNASSEAPSFQTLGQFLAERPDLFQQKRLIVFALNAPYFLDATDISKLTAYYGLYSKTPQFIDVAAYLLFHELRPVGALPVSVRGVSYDLSNALFPDPDKAIVLELDLLQPQAVTTTSTPEPIPIPEFRVGDVISIRTAVILDHNGRPVPDGTPVEFSLTIGGKAASPRQVVATVGGIARATFSVNNSGTLEIRAESEPAQPGTMVFEIPAPGDITQPAPTETPTPTPTSTPTPTLAPIPIVNPPPSQPRVPVFTDWLMALLLSAVLGWAVYRLAVQLGQVLWGIRCGFLIVICGLLAYSFLALQLPGSERLLQNSISRGVFLVTLTGCITGLVIAWLWRTFSLSSRADQ